MFLEVSGQNDFFPLNLWKKNLNRTASLRPPLSNLQLEILDTFSRQVSTEDLFAIRKILADYFAQKVMAEADKLWDERGYTQDTMNQWLESHW